MKTVTVLKSIFLGVLFSLTNCQADKTDPEYPGYIKGKHNGKDWLRPKIKISYLRYCSPVKEKIGFSVAANTSFSYLDEWVSIYHIPTKSGIYTVENNDFKQNCSQVVANNSWVNIDVSLADYKVYKTPTKYNQVTISKIDTVANTVEGSFELFFIATKKDRPVFPDTIQLSGTFQSPISLPYK